jgi:hypothetical protein
VTIGRLFGRGAENSGKDHIRTLPHDGRKEVDFDKLLKDPGVKDRIKRLREEVIEPQRKRARKQR